MRSRICERGSARSLRYKGEEDSLKFNPHFRMTRMSELSVPRVSLVSTSSFEPWRMKSTKCIYSVTKTHPRDGNQLFVRKCPRAVESGSRGTRNDENQWGIRDREMTPLVAGAVYTCIPVPRDIVRSRTRFRCVSEISRIRDNTCGLRPDIKDSRAN